ncbi:MAG: MotA/TolQ/ExbB proton channel family protein [Verrucomicrobiota bacterium]
MIKALGIFVVFLATLSFFGASLLEAQDLDLGIPGMETESTPASSSKSAEGEVSKSEISLFDMIKAGGPTMIVLLLLLFAVIFLVVYGLIDLRKPNFAPPELVTNLKKDMEKIDLEAAKARLDPSDNCLSAVMSAGIAHLSAKGYGALETEKFEELLGGASQRFNRGRARTINYFSVIAQAAPMLGLLGTVSGMILAFGSLSNSGGGDPSVFADDISMALVTTAGGLVVALPAIFAYFFMRDRLQSLVSTSDDAVEEITETLRNSLAAYGQQQEQQPQQ